MATLISNTLLALGIATAACSLVAVPALAAEPKKTEAKKPVAKKRPTHKIPLVKAAPEFTIPAVQEDEPDVTDNKTIEYSCELGNKITIYHNETDDKYIALRWKKRLHRLSRVGTTTGAQRFENTNFGLIWIGIPAKGMLLDSKQNRQLANECKTAEQMKPVAIEAEPKKT
jgi:membrane-bound inhibitor of C-type lysozyme